MLLVIKCLKKVKKQNKTKNASGKDVSISALQLDRYFVFVRWHLQDDLIHYLLIFDFNPHNPETPHSSQFITTISLFLLIFKFLELALLSISTYFRLPMTRVACASPLGKPKQNPWAKWLQHQQFICSQFRRLAAQGKALAGLVSPEALSLGLWMLPSPCVLTGSS